MSLPNKFTFRHSTNSRYVHTALKSGDGDEYTIQWDNGHAVESNITWHDTTTREMLGFMNTEDGWEIIDDLDEQMKYYSVIKIKPSGKIKGVYLFDVANDKHITQDEKLAKATLDNMKRQHPEYSYKLISWEE